MKRVLGEEYPSTAWIYHNLGRLYLEQGKYQEAEELLIKSLRIKERVLGEVHPDTALICRNLAVLYERREKYEPALTYCLRSYKIYSSIFGMEHSDTENAYNAMERIYRQWDAKGDFRQWLEEQMKETEETSIE